MPHAAQHAADFRHYAARRTKALKQIREMGCYLSQLEQVVKAMPADASNAGYLDLDNVKQLNCDMKKAAELLCDWESLGLEFSRLGVK